MAADVETIGGQTLARAVSAPADDAHERPDGAGNSQVPPCARAILLLILVGASVSCGSGASVEMSSAATPHSVQLSWTASTSPSVVGYNVYRSNAPAGPFVKITPTPVSDTTYTDTTVVSGSTYYYVATSVDSSGQESSYSNAAEAVVP